MNLLHDRDIEAALPERARDLDRNPAPKGGARPGPAVRRSV
jgi:hypothetical protein